MFQRVVHAYLNFWKKAFSMTGRANRFEYWVPLIVHVMITRLIGMADPQLMSPDPAEVVPFTMTGAILLALSFVLFIPSMTLFARRLQDIDFDGKLTYLFYFFQGLVILSSIAYYFYSVEEVTQMFTPSLYFMLGIMTIIVNIAQLVIALWPGTKDSNKYGEPSR